MATSKECGYDLGWKCLAVNKSRTQLDQTLMAAKISFSQNLHFLGDTGTSNGLIINNEIIKYCMDNYSVTRRYLDRVKREYKPRFDVTRDD